MQCYYNVKPKGKEQNKKAHRAAGQSYTMSTKQKNNMKGAHIITCVGKGVNHEKTSIRDIKRDKNRLQGDD